MPSSSADFRPGLQKINCPTLVLCGRQDQLTPLECSEEMAAAIPGANLVVVEECGHLSTLERPAEVNAAMRTWLAGVLNAYLMRKNESTSPSPASARRHRIQEYVRWSDVDVSGIIRWGTYVRFVEMAETELFRAAGFPYATLWDRLDIWLPRVQFHLDYRNPARLDELLDIEIWVGRIGRSSIRLEFAVKKPDGDLAAEGYLVIVSIDRKNAKSVDVPKLLLEALAPYTIPLPPPLPRPSPARGEGDECLKTGGCTIVRFSSG